LSYRVKLTTRARKDFRSLSRANQIRVKSVLLGLADQPRPADCEKVRSRKNTWRVRLGDYRVVYEIREKEILVLVLRIQSRDEVYNFLSRIR